MLRAEDGRSLAGSLGQLLAGLAFCVVVGFFFASVVTFVLWMTAGTSYIGWFGWFGASSGWSMETTTVRSWCVWAAGTRSPRWRSA